VVSHTKLIWSVTDPFFGADNDKTISRFDDAINNVRLGVLSRLEWERFNSTGHIVKENGLYLICNNGYFKWGCLLSPAVNRIGEGHLDLWSKRLESVRKDVECTFGILKARFHVLKHDVRLHGITEIGHVFVSCCVLHNMLLKHDEYDDWETHAVILEDDDDVSK
jgi:hypothetical protein